MRWTARVAAALFATAVLAVALGGAAGATAGKHATIAHRAAHAVPGKHLPPVAALPSALPPKYTVVISALLTAAAGTQTLGTMTCPGKKVPYGGGAVISGTSTLVNLNSSVPTSTGWRVYVNNASAASNTFQIYVVCAKKNSSWSIVSGTAVDNPAGAQNTATVSCPTGTKVMGGGVFASSGSTSVNINSTLPLGSGKGKKASYGWRGDVNNASTGDDTITAQAVCGRAAGYSIVTGTPVLVNAGSQTGAAVACPSPAVPLGGGGFSSSGSPLVDLNSSLPLSNGWEVYEDNNSTGASSITAYAVCAGA